MGGDLFCPTISSVLTAEEFLTGPSSFADKASYPILISRIAWFFIFETLSVWFIPGLFKLGVDAGPVSHSAPSV